MSPKRVLLLFDFSLSGYAAHYKLARMHDPEPFDVTLLVVGFRRRYPAPTTLRRFADKMAETHRKAGATATVRFSTEHPHDVVREALVRERFSLIVAGSELACCLRQDDSSEWLVVEPVGGRASRVENWSARTTTGFDLIERRKQRILRASDVKLAPVTRDLA